MVDIPHSDAESDTTDTTMPEVTPAGLEEGIIEPEAMTTAPDDLDYDAEGEDEDVAMERMCTNH